MYTLAFVFTISPYLYILEGGICTGIAPPFSQNGYIATSDLHVFVKCDPPSSCRGLVSTSARVSNITDIQNPGNNPYCADGYYGPTCSTCLTKTKDPNGRGFYRLNLECAPCPEIPVLTLAYYVLGVIGVFIALLMYLRAVGFFKYIQALKTKLSRFIDKELLSMSVTFIQSKLVWMESK